MNSAAGGDEGVPGTAAEFVAEAFETTVTDGG